MKKRKTLSLPAALVERIEKDAEELDRSFNYVAVQALRRLFFPATVRRSKSAKSAK